MAELAVRTRDFRVDQFSGNRTPSASDVVATSTGGFAVVWRTENSVFSGREYSVNLSLFTADGTRNFNEINFGSNFSRFGSSDPSFRPSVTTQEDGTITTIWATYSLSQGGFPPRSVVGRSLETSGNLVSFTVEPSNTLLTSLAGLFANDIAPRAGGGFVTSHIFAANPNTFGTFAVETDIFAAGSTLIDGNFVTGTTNSGDQKPTLVRLTDGRFLSTWTDTGTDSLVVRGRFLDVAGLPTGAVLTLATAQGVSVQAATVAGAGLDGGGFVLAWTVAQGGSFDVRARRYGSNGAPLGAEFTVHSSLAGSQADPSVAKLSDGSFVIAWTDEGDVRAQRFLADGTATGPEFTVNEDTTGVQGDSAIAAGPNGSLIITWSGSATDGGFLLQIGAKIYALTNSVDGGVGVDLLTGTDGADVIRGFAGDDVINALGGNDEIYAGAGADRVDAGSGDDLVDPGTGADVLDGGTGRDTLTFVSALAGVTVSLTDGRAQIAGDALKTLTNFEDVLGSQFADTITGDSGANRIEGFSGDDVIRGLGGDDVLLAGAGNDTVMPGAGMNNSDGGAGIDLLDLSDLTAGVIIDLNVGAFWNGTFTQASLNFENATGTAFNDAIYGQESGGNVIDGGTGGADMLYGGRGAGDVVSYVSNARGVIIDFSQELSFDGIAQDRVVGFEEAIGTAFNDSIFGTFTQTIDPGSGGKDTIVNAGLLAYNSNARGVIIDMSVGLSFDGVDQDSFTGISSVRGSRFDDDIFGSSGNDTIDGGAGFDRLLGGPGNDTFILRRGEADGDLIRDFAGNGAAAGDSIRLSGYSGGSTFTKLAGNSTTWLITDAASGAVDVVRIFGDLHPSDWAFAG